MKVEFEEWLGIGARIVSVKGADPAIAYPGLIQLGAPQTAENGSILTFDASLRNNNGTLLTVKPNTAANKALKKPALNMGWDLCQLEHKGKTPVASPSTLPNWDPSNGKIVAEYFTWTDAVLGAVAKDPDLQRIEGRVPFVDRTGMLVWDLIRIVYVENALVDAGPNATRDWIAIGTSMVSLPGKQEGGGHGPPH